VGLGFGVWGLGFGVWGLGFGFWVWGLGRGVWVWSLRFGYNTLDSSILWASNKFHGCGVVLEGAPSIQHIYLVICRILGDIRLWVGVP